MNSKRVTYKEAVKRLRTLSKIQQEQKSFRKLPTSRAYKAIIQRQVELNKKEINLLLSIIAERKDGNLLYEKVRYLKSEMRQLVGSENV